MKPIVIFTETKDGQIIMSTEEFQKHINDAYEAGRNDVLKYNFEQFKYVDNSKFPIYDRKLEPTCEYVNG